MKRQKANKLLQIGIFFIIGIFCYLAPNKAALAAENASWVRVYSTKDFSLKSEFLAFEEHQKIGMDVALVDFNGDGVKSIVVAPANDYLPVIKVFDSRGNLQNEYLAYAENYRQGINLSACDLEGNGREELVVGTNFGGGPQIRIFRQNGENHNTAGFFAFSENLRKGVRVSCADLSGDGKDEIVASSVVDSQSQVKIFGEYGKKVTKILSLSKEKIERPLEVIGLDISGDSIDVLAVNLGYGHKPSIFLISGEGGFIRSFEAYGNFYGGVSLAAADMNGDKKEEIITSPGFTGSPHIRIFNGLGNPVKTMGWFAFSEKLRGGIRTAAGDVDGDGEIEIVTVMEKLPWHNYNYNHYILIDISDQYLEYYDYGFKKNRYTISSGSYKLPTPLGTFKIMNKSENAYSSRYRLWMPYWMQFTAQGHGLHGLPYWIRNGQLVHEGEYDLGLRVSHGCVRVSVENAKILFNWAKVGTTIIIRD